MALYDFIKDAITLAQKADNGELIKQLLEIGQMALDLQNENAQLKKTIAELENMRNFEDDVVRHIEPYYTLKSDGEDSGLYYCATCFGKDKIKIQMYYDGESKLSCPLCKTSFSMTPQKRIQRIG